MSIVLPSLTEDGWVLSEAKQADYLLSHFFLSDYSQSYIYNNEVSSFSWIVAQHDGDPVMMSINLKSTLERYFLKYFNEVDLEITNEKDPYNDNKVILKIYMQFTGKDNKTYNLGKLVFLENTIVKKIVDINNG